MNNTIIYKTKTGWNARTSIPVEGSTMIEVRTYKSSRGSLVTYANQCTVSDDQSMIEYAPFSMWGKRVAEYDIRCTEKSVIAQHNKVLTLVPEFKTELSNYKGGQR